MDDMVATAMREYFNATWHAAFEAYHAMLVVYGERFYWNEPYKSVGDDLMDIRQACVEGIKICIDAKGE